MKQIIIAFDVDGTIYGNSLGSNVNGSSMNLEVVHLMILLKKHIRNSRIIVWSGGGKNYAESIVNKFGLTQYVDGVYDKHKYEESLYGEVDIAFDDEQSFALAHKNLIVR